MYRKVLILQALVFAFLFVNADPIKELLKQTGCSSDYPNANVLVVFDSTLVKVQESGLSYTYTHQLFKVLTSRGALDKRIIKYGYDPLSAWAEIKKVKIYRKDGSVEELDSEVFDYPAPARMIYWGAREKMIEVGKLEPGDAVEVFLFRKGFTYALLYNEGDDDRYIPPMRGHFYDIVPFWSSDPVVEKVYQTSIPADKNVQYEFYNGEAKSSVILEGDNMVYTFSKKDIKPIKREPNMVANDDVAPKLLISTSPDWKAKSLWFYGVNEDYGSFESTPEIDLKVDEILAKAQNEEDSISLLTHWVADEIRYSGISMGEGEGFTLHSGEMNFTDRCGVCKDKAGMLITMLRSAGFESYPAMTMAGSRIDYIPADQFNHCVTLVKKKNGEYQLLDPTWVPFLRELWSSAEQQQNYLPGIPEGSDLMITPLSAPENHYFKIRGESEITEEGTLNGWMKITAEGQSDGAIRRYFTRNYRANWDKSLESEILNLSPKAKIIKMDYGDPIDYQSGPIEIFIEYTIPDYATVNGEMIIFDPVITSGVFKGGMAHLYINTGTKERMYPFRDRCSRLVTLEETIKFPAGYQAINQSCNKDFGDKVSSFNGNFEIDKGKIKIKETISLGKRVYEPEDWNTFKKVVKAQKEFADKKVILTKNK